MTAKCVKETSGLEVGKKYEIEYCVIEGFHTDVHVAEYGVPPVSSTAFDENFQKALQKAINYFNKHYGDYDDTEYYVDGCLFIRDF